MMLRLIAINEKHEILSPASYSTIVDKRLTMQFPTMNLHEFSNLLSECGKLILVDLDECSRCSVHSRCVEMRHIVSFDMFSSTLIATYGNCNQSCDIAHAPFSDTRPLLYANPSLD